MMTELKQNLIKHFEKSSNFIFVLKTRKKKEVIGFTAKIK